MNKVNSPAQQAFLDLLVIVPPIIPFGLLVGITVADFNFPSWYAPLSSLAIYAGGAQIAQLHALYQGESIWLSIFIAAVISSRYLMYSAALAPLFSPLPRTKRLWFSYLLTDQCYAFTTLHGKEGYSQSEQIKYYAIFGVFFWLFWQIWTVLGLFVGNLLPESTPTASIIPFVFISMAALSISNRAQLISFLVGAFVAVLFDFLPYRSGLLMGALAGILSGVAWDIYRGRLNAT